jgi:prepilin-type N-terminal cleavage/methylation domain-containing protein
MLQKMTRTNEKGFTLIELMIVIAIIGILAAIAIPNFIAYRNKAFCSAAETDANGVAAAIAEYFAVPTRIVTPADPTQLHNGNGYKFSGPVGSENTGTITGADANVNITITVTDNSGRCPGDYQTAMSVAQNTNSYWAAGVYTKLITY